MTRITKTLDINGLLAYRKANPVKFAHKFGNIDFENLPDGFSIEDYKKKVVMERVKRENSGTSQSLPEITPQFFYPTNDVSVEPSQDKPEDSEVIKADADINENDRPSTASISRSESLSE